VVKQQFPVWRGNFPVRVAKFPVDLPREFARKQLIDNADFDGRVGDIGQIPG